MSLAEGGAGLLTLERKIGQSILIGDNIKVLVVAIGNGKCKLGIECPKDIVILRSELKRET